jgi:hypothetical protein
MKNLYSVSYKHFYSDYNTLKEEKTLPKYVVAENTAQALETALRFASERFQLDGCKEIGTNVVLAELEVTK